METKFYIIFNMGSRTQEKGKSMRQGRWTK